MNVDVEPQSPILITGRIEIHGCPYIYPNNGRIGMDFGGLVLRLMVGTIYAILSILSNLSLLL